MPRPADLEAQLAQQLRSVQAQAAALVGAVNKGMQLLAAITASSNDHSHDMHCTAWLSTLVQQQLGAARAFCLHQLHTCLQMVQLQTSRRSWPS